MQKVTFKCIRSGNLVSFVNENDIAGLRSHEGYVEVKEVPPEPAKATPKLKKHQIDTPSFLRD